MCSRPRAERVQVDIGLPYYERNYVTAGPGPAAPNIVIFSEYVLSKSSPIINNHTLQ